MSLKFGYIVPKGREAHAHIDKRKELFIWLFVRVFQGRLSMYVCFFPFWF